jgi:acetyl esterase/lipase
MAEPTILTVDDYVKLPAVTATARYTYGADPAQFGDLYIPAQGEQHPVIVLIHGGCWRAQYGLAQLGNFCATFAALGVAVWSLEYRRLGNDGGWPHTFFDIAAGADYLRTLAAQHSLDLSRVVAVGHSAGGHLALWLAARHRLPATSPLATSDPLAPIGVVALAGIPDLVDAEQRNLCRGAVTELMNGTAEAVPAHYAAASPSAHLPLGIPQHLIIGDLDQAVQVEHNTIYVATARQLGDTVQYTILPNTGHFEIVAPGTTVWPTVEEAILRMACVAQV